MKRAKMAIQCVAACGNTGSFLFSGEISAPVMVSPVFSSVAELAPWMMANGWRSERPGSLITDYVKVDQPDLGYLQHGQAPGPFRTESVTVKQSGWRPNGQCWLARYEGRWRVVHVQVNRTFIVYRGARITIQIEGV